MGAPACNADAPTPFIEQQLQTSVGPIIAATDYVCAVPESVRAYLPEGRRYITLGTDGFGRSDTRTALREYFGVDAQAIVKAAVQSVGIGTSPPRPENRLMQRCACIMM